ncbi:MAG: hypothetical protein GY753_00980 [Gammaproteobacteria bacterium]|nr:hypothetical protein [Gammaproteobacteria bacterium]
MIMKFKTMKLNSLTILGALGIGLLLSSSSFGATNQTLIDILVNNGVMTKAQAKTISNKGHGTDQALIDVLVKNGALTTAQARNLSNKPGKADYREADETRFDIRSKKVEGVEFFGHMHIQYDHIAVEDGTSGVGDPDSINSFIVRDFTFGTEINLVNDWSGALVARFNDEDPELDRAYIAKGYDNGEFKAGYKKVNFGYEENTSSSDIKSLERSMVTRYFTESPNYRRVGVGGRHLGIFVDGAYENFGYGAAITSGWHGGDDDDDQRTNQLGYYANAFYNQQYDGDNNEFEVGVNLGYQPEGNSNYYQGYYHDSGYQAKYVFGYNPYLAVTSDKFRFVAEYLGADIEEGSQGGGDNAHPWGINIIPSYRVTDDIELVFRYSYFDGDSRGIRIRDGIRRAENPDSDPSYDKAEAYYLGLNWYIDDNDIKFTAGYEHAEFSDRLDGSGEKLSGGEDADAGAFRARLQFLF